MDKIREEYKPKITVITPTYNRAAFLDEIIRSVLAQDYKDFEYFILDDGSTDNTEEVVRPYLEDSRVRYLKHANTGEAETVNWGWNLAKGEYFTQVNSDDPILPGLFSEMVKILDEKKEFVVAYPDFYFINKEGKIIKKDKTPDWDFLDALAAFSCYAASAGTFIRKSAFQDWKVIKNSKYKHISDIDMYWKMALEGNFYHVPKFLATWRSHEDAISSERYKCIPEVHAWFNEYFSCKDIPNDILNIKEKVLNSINDYCIFLLKQSNVANKSQLISEYKRKYLFKYKNLQIGDNDLIGNKFNGHDLHQYLREKRIDSSHLVWNKESTDANTFIISGDKKNRQEIYKFVGEIQKEYKLDGILNPIMLDIIYNKLFLESDIVHLHLMHNGLMDINLLPLLTKLKPTVWTLHDQWPLSGNCIQHFERECDQWKNSALIYELKKHAIQNSNVEIIVASKLMFNKVKESLAFNEKNIHLIPFGINQDIFKPLDKLKARIKLNIPKNALVISFRGDNNYKKGVDYVEYVIKNIKTNKELYFLVFGGATFYKKNGYKYIEYGWIKDDFLISDIYNASDLFLMPSTIESFGMMAIEAMSCETLPIVLDGDKTALPDTVNAPECGVSVKKDKEEYLKTVQFYIDHEKERKERANKCLEFARKNYSKDKYVDKIMEVYKEVMAKHKMSEEDEILLAQLKEYMVTEPKKEIDESFMCKIENTEIVNCSAQQFKVNTNSRLIAFLKKIVVMNTSPATRIFLKNKLNRLCQPKNNFKTRARNLIKKIIKWVLFKSSITFRTLTYILNKETELSWKIENFEKSNEQNIANLMQKFDNVKKSNEQETNILLEKIENFEKINKKETSNMLEKFELLCKQNEQTINRIDLLNIGLQTSEENSNKSKKKILFVAMLNSIHTARWLSQFKDNEQYEIHLFPVNSEKVHMLIMNEPKFIIHNYIFSNEDTLQYNASDAIEDVINFIKPDIVHTLEMQHSAYLVLPIKKKFGNRFPLWFYSCWGNDIKWFEQFPEHKEKIIQVLEKCDALFCEDEQTIKNVVESYNFNKPILNVHTIGGFHIDYYRNKFKFIPPSKRELIVIKGYTGWVHKSETIFEAIKLCHKEIIDKKLTIVVYLPGDVNKYVSELLQLGLKMEIFKCTEDHDKVMELFSNAKINIASSLSDGIPTTMLEGMIMGAFPIQSFSSLSSSANEYIINNKNGYLLDPTNINGYAEAIKKAISDDKLLDDAAAYNFKLMKEKFDYNTIRDKVLKFYRTFLDQK